METLTDDLGRDSIVTPRNTAYDRRTVMARDIRSPDSDGTRNTRLHRIDSQMVGTRTFIKKKIRRRARVMLKNRVG